MSEKLMNEVKYVYLYDPRMESYVHPGLYSRGEKMYSVVDAQRFVDTAVSKYMKQHPHLLLCDEQGYIAIDSIEAFYNEIGTLPKLDLLCGETRLYAISKKEIPLGVTHWRPCNR